MKALMCPNCKAKIEAEAGREHVFCSFCGGKILLRELLEIREEEKEPDKVIYMRKLETGDGFLRMNDYYRAEMVYVELMNEFPDYASAYERMIRICTRDYTVFRIENKERVLSYLSKFQNAATEEELTDCAQMKRAIETAVWQEHERSEDALEMPKINLEHVQRDTAVLSATVTAVFAFLVAVFMKILSIRPGGTDPLTGALSGFMFVLAFAAAGFAVYSKKKYK